ncbi:putative mitochondrial inner membrane nuclease Nuc1 [Aspergillus steynii IBT 23096]|uniref:Endonuclease n=1 Tax=Aspergillus steynii IBT 23096 TaxID=1392250 RepID=A0A2I2GA29_9EURO|nr:putative mitochondrial inner membrane nuclease Nuc1 [Aspergillus steynii IBT 23096]PLB49732.1 putative mitochondrial inner membrane nuclease Nuc1 [Aspergillus steynii IBT 23096]
MSRGKLASVAALGAAAGAASSLLYTKAQEQDRFPPDTISVSSPIIETKNLSFPSPISIFKEKEITSGPANPAGILKYGFPGPISDELKSLSLYGGYDRRTRNPSWVAEHITTESVAKSIASRKNYFREDPDIPAFFRAKVADYAGSGYDRGHQVPAANANWSQEAMDDTFKMSNMCPQVGIGFNQHYWARVEKFTRNLTTRYPSVRVVTGPLYLPHRDSDSKWRVSYEVIGDPPNVAVPTHFYKVVFGEEEDNGDGLGGQVAIAAFVLPNAPIDKDKDLSEFEVELEAVERGSGLEFARKLDAKQRKKLCEEVKCDVRIQDFARQSKL